MKKRMAILVVTALVFSLVMPACAPADVEAGMTATETQPVVYKTADDAVTGGAVDAATGQAVRTKYTKKVPYRAIRKKLRGKRASAAYEFKDINKKKSSLTLYGYYKVFKIPHYGYGDFAETVVLWPTITAQKSGSSSVLSMGMTVRSIVQIHGSTSRKYKKMVISGGGESVTLKGSSSSRSQRKGEYLNYLLTTTAKFTISKNTSATDEKLDKLMRILSSNNLKITVKDSAKKLTRKCGIDSNNAEKMAGVLSDYKSLLKKYAV